LTFKTKLKQNCYVYVFYRCCCKNVITRARAGLNQNSFIIHVIKLSRSNYRTIARCACEAMAFHYWYHSSI